MSGAAAGRQPPRFFLGHQDWEAIGLVAARPAAVAGARGAALGFDDRLDALVEVYTSVPLRVRAGTDRKRRPARSCPLYASAEMWGEFRREVSPWTRKARVQRRGAVRHPVTEPVDVAAADEAEALPVGVQKPDQNLRHVPVDLASVGRDVARVQQRAVRVHAVLTPPALHRRWRSAT